jgi:aspartate aminotransferase
MNSIDGVSCIKPDGAFYVMMNISKLIGKEINGVKITGSDAFAEQFLEVAKVAVVPGKSFGTDIHVRWSYATSMENIKTGLDRLEAFVAQLK